MTNHKDTKKNTFAAIDVGTNAARLKIVQIHENPLRVDVLYEERDAIRPGEGVFKNRKIHPDAVTRLHKTLKKYQKAIKGFSAQYVALATASFRAAENGQDVAKELKNKTGIDLQIIEGLEEARLVCLAALYPQEVNKNEVIIDIGGGSTEICLTKGKILSKSWSLQLGALLLKDKFPENEQSVGKRLHLMRIYIDRICRLYLKSKSLKIKMPSALGTSGSIRALEKFINPLRPGMNQAQVRTALIQLAKMSVDEREEHFPSARAEVIVAAASILLGLMEYLKIDIIYSTNGSLKDGILWDMYDKQLLKNKNPHQKDNTKKKNIKKNEDAEIETIENHRLIKSANKLLTKFNADLKHANQCQFLATQLFDLFIEQHQLDTRNKLLLATAALLHDIGHAINPHKHHRHSEYIVENTDFPQVSRREHRIIAKLCRYHRKRSPKKGHEAITQLDSQEIEIIHLLFPLLRLADALDRSHLNVVKNIDAKFEGDHVTIFISVDDKAALEVWAAQQLAEIFQQYYHLTLGIKII